jgi:hypothetical protein
MNFSDSPDPHRKLSVLQKKFRNATDLCIEMKRERFRDRPNCKEILNQKELWTLSLNDIQLKEMIENFSKSHSSKDSFVFNFLNIKLKNSSNLKNFYKYGRNNISVLINFILFIFVIFMFHLLSI